LITSPAQPFSDAIVNADHLQARSVVTHQHQRRALFLSSQGQHFTQLRQCFSYAWHVAILPVNFPNSPRARKDGSTNLNVSAEEITQIAGIEGHIWCSLF